MVMVNDKKVMERSLSITPLPLRELITTLQRQWENGQKSTVQLQLSIRTYFRLTNRYRPKEKVEMNGNSAEYLEEHDFPSS